MWSYAQYSKIREKWNKKFVKSQNISHGTKFETFVHGVLNYRDDLVQKFPAIILSKMEMGLSIIVVAETDLKIADSVTKVAVATMEAIGAGGAG